MSIIDRLFKKKPPIDVIIEPKFDVPEVIKEGKLKPTTCAGCHSVYQAKARHIKGEPFCRDERVTECPVCHFLNKVEFEDDTV